MGTANGAARIVGEHVQRIDASKVGDAQDVFDFTKTPTARSGWPAIAACCATATASCRRSGLAQGAADRHLIARSSTTASAACG